MGRLLTLFGSDFQPTDIPGLAVWLDAADIGTFTLASGNVAEWRDKSGRLNHSSEGTALRQPRRVLSAINGRAAVQGRHDGTNASRLLVADAASLDYSTYTHFVVGQRAADLNVIEFLAGKYDPNNNQREHAIRLSAADQLSAVQTSDGTTTAATVLSQAGTVTVGTPFIFVTRYNGTQLSVSLNGGAFTNTASPAPFQGNGPYSLFSLPNLADPFAGLIAEDLFYTTALTDNSVSSLVQYLRAKWGIA
jgi:hypothetical protein